MNISTEMKMEEKNLEENIRCFLGDLVSQAGDVAIQSGTKLHLFYDDALLQKHSLHGWYGWLETDGKRIASSSFCVDVDLVDDVNTISKQVRHEFSEYKTTL